MKSSGKVGLTFPIIKLQLLKYRRKLKKDKQHGIDGGGDNSMQDNPEIILAKFLLFFL